MRRGILVALAAAAIAFPASTSAASATPLHELCGAGYVAANLPWGHKCLRAGEFCKIDDRAYRRYHFVCPASGHLKRR